MFANGAKWIDNEALGVIRTALREGDVIHVVCDRLDDVSEMLERLESRSRDFR